MRKRRIRAFVFSGAFLLFLLLMDYPYLSRLYNDIISGEVIASCSENEQYADCEKRRALAMSYNRYLALEASCPVKEGEWEFEKGWMAAARVLCPDDSDLAGWIRISALQLILPLYIGTGDEVLGKGAGILEEHSLPVGGAGTHACISAHRGLPDRTLFTNLDMLESGDRIEVHTLGRTICYEIFDHETVKPSDMKSLAILPGKDLLTLITCTPYGINTHRLYVHAKRCFRSTERGKDPDFFQRLIRGITDPVFWKLWWWVPATAALLLFLIILVRGSIR